MPQNDEKLEGGCACAAVRYRLDAVPFDAGYCHCRMCQLTSGAPVMAFATVRRQDHVLLKGEPVRRASSQSGERWFCGACGTPLAMRLVHQPETIDFTIASLDDPERIAPGFHIWERRRIGWFETADDLPRHERFRPGTIGSRPAAAGNADRDQSESRSADGTEASPDA